MNHLKEIQSRLQQVPIYSDDGTYYPTDNIKLRYVEKTIKKLLVLGEGEIKSAYDFGCGTGIYVQELINQGIDTVGFDANLAIKEELKTDEHNIIFTNLEYPISPNFLLRDLVLSIEFLEHLSEQGGKLLFAMMTRLSKQWIIMTASPEEGLFHLNPQPAKYWIKGIENLKTHKYKHKISMELMRYFRQLIPNGLIWFKRDLMVFERISNV